MPVRLRSLSQGGNLGGRVRLRDLSAPPKKPEGRSVGGFLGNLAGDLRDAAVGVPAGVFEAGKALGGDVVSDVTFGAVGGKADRTAKLGKQIADAYAQTYGPLVRGDIGQFGRNVFEHPLGPILDAATVATLGAGAGVRGAAVANVVKGGQAGKAGAVAKALAPGRRPPPRTVRVGDLEVRDIASINPVVEAAQRLKDRQRQAAAERNPGSRAAGRLDKQAGKALERERKVAETRARSAALRLDAIGRKLKPEEQVALRLVAEEAPVKRRIAASELRKARAKSASEARRHGQRISLMEKAAQFLDDTGAKPAFAKDAKKLQGVFDLLKQVAGNREELLAAIDRLSPEASRAAKTKQGRLALGAEIEGKGKKAQLVGAEDFEASPEAVFVGAPSQRSRLTGQPRVGAQTIGFPRQPGSLKRSEGANIARARERLDTTRIVAERNLEAVRLTGVLRARDQLKRAGRPSPVRDDDIFIRLDKLPSSKRLPSDVRRFIDDPEQLAAVTDEQARSIVESVRSHVFSKPLSDLDPETVAGFEKLAEEGKGVFVPRRVVGSLAKRDPNSALRDVLGTRAVGVVDEINSAQKLAVIYLKPAYAAPQILSNAFFNLIQQGFAAPLNLTRAAKLNSRLGEGAAAVIDDLMGEGFVRVLSGQGRGPASRAASATAGTLTRFVDAPFRRASFLHEAAKKGAKTPEQIASLLDDPGRLGDLTEVVTRANRAIVDFGEMTPAERALLTRVVFVYPWIRGATVFGGRFLRDRPIQSNALANLSNVGLQRAEEQRGPAPSYLRGSFVVGGRLLNPASFNQFQTPAEVGQSVARVITGRGGKFSLPASFASPVLSAAQTVATGQTPEGFPAGSLPNALNEEFFQGQPSLAVARALGAFGGPRSTLYRDTPRDALLRFLVASGIPRRFNRAELNRRARRGD